MKRLASLLLVTVLLLGQHPRYVPGGGGGGGAPGSGVTFGGNPVEALAEDTGVDLELVGTTLTARTDTNIPTKKNIQDATMLTCVPTSGSGTAYSGCGSLSPTITSQTLGGPIFFKPDVASGASPTFDPDGAGALVAKNMQKLQYGALTNIIANDLNPLVLYLVWYESTADKYIVVPMENRFDEDATYFYTRLGSTGSGAFIRQPKGVNSIEFRRSDNADYSIVGGGTLRSFDSSNNIRWSYSPNQSLGAAAMSYSIAATNDDPEENVIFCRAATTDATLTTLCTIATTASQTAGMLIEITARRTGGTAGAAEDGAFYTMQCAFKNTAGTAAEIAAETIIAQTESQDWTPSCAVNAGNALIQVTGATNNNITWHATVKRYRVGT